MYCSHFGLHRPPFNNTPDPSFYYSTPDHEEALATLQYATLNRKGFVLVSGEVGAGKTLIGRMFIRQIDRQASTAVITHTQLNARQLLAAICAEFELDVPADATNLQLADSLQEYLLDQFARDRFAVVLIDEGQNLPDESFEALRMLGNLEADDAKLLQVCILGQPELRERFKSDSMRQFDQRLFRRFHLAGLTECQTHEYIQRRLTVAGCARNDIFSPEALARIHSGSQGIPRLINRICDNALLAAYAKGRGVVDEALVAQVLDQEGLRPLDSGVNTTAATEQKIEQIYGTAPELTENEQAGASAPQNDDRLHQIREVMTRATEQWPALKDAIERHRIDLQKSVDEAAARCRNAEQQIETVARTAVPAEAIEELRQLHQNQTGRVMEEIVSSRSSIQNLVSQTEARLAETETKLREIGTTSATVESVTRLQERQDEQLRDALAQVEQHRRHIEELIQLLGAQCQQTQVGVTALIESQNENQAAWADRFEEKLVEYQAAMKEQVQAAARAQDVQALRDNQAALQSDWSNRLDQSLAELNNGLQAQLQTTATKSDLEALRQTQSAAREQLNRESRASLEETQARIHKQLQTKASVEQVDVIREAQHQARVELEQQLASIRDSLNTELSTTVRRDELNELRQATAPADLVHAVEAKASRTQSILDDHRADTAEALAQLSDHLGEARSAQESRLQDHAEALAGQETAIADIFASVGRHEDEIRQLSHQATERFETLTHDIGELKEGACTRSDVERLRGEHQALTRDILERFEQKATELEFLKNTLDEQLVEAADGQRAAIAELANRLDSESKQLRECWSNLADSHAVVQQRLASLDEQYASREELNASRAEVAAQLNANRADLSAEMAAQLDANGAELEAIRQAQSAQADQMLEQIQASRQAIQNLIDELAERFRTTHERLDSLTAAASAEESELTELRRTQAEDVASLLRQLEDQRRLSQEQFEQLLAHWNRTRDEMDSLRAFATDTSALEELRQYQTRQSEQIFGVIAEQRQTLESLIHAADQRCDVMLARIDALPANVASTDDIQALHEESRGNKAALESAIRSVADQCDQTGRILSTLQDHAASVDSHLEQIRQDHAQNLDEIIQRLDGQTTEYHQEFDALNQRWTGLRTELQRVAGSAMPVAQFEAAERLISRDMIALKSRLDQIADRRQKDVRVLVDVVQRLNDRVKQLEEMDRPQPVRVELRPRAAEELAELNTAAESKAAELRTLLSQMNTVGDQLRGSTSQVEQAMNGWSEQVGRVQKQSEQLRISATASAGILQAMRKCHDTIDSKLKSPAWHGQMRRGEELTARLEQVLPHYQEFEGMVNTWAEQRKDADALVAHLERLLAEANRATVRLGRVGAMLAGVAGKSTIAETVEAARHHDEQVRPTRGPARKVNHGKAVEPVAWPQYRSHMKANAG